MFEGRDAAGSRLRVSSVACRRYATPFVVEIPLVLGSDIKLARIPSGRRVRGADLASLGGAFGVRRITDRNQRFGLACHPWLPPNVGRRQLLARLPMAGLGRRSWRPSMAAFLSETRHRNQPRRSSLMKRACRMPLWRFASALGKPTFIGHLSPASAGLFFCRPGRFHGVWVVPRLAGRPASLNLELLALAPLRLGFFLRPSPVGRKLKRHQYVKSHAALSAGSTERSFLLSFR